MQSSDLGIRLSVAKGLETHLCRSISSFLSCANHTRFAYDSDNETTNSAPRALDHTEVWAALENLPLEELDPSSARHSSGCIGSRTLAHKLDQPSAQVSSADVATALRLSTVNANAPAGAEELGGS